MENISILTLSVRELLVIDTDRFAMHKFRKMSENYWWADNDNNTLL